MTSDATTSGSVSRPFTPFGSHLRQGFALSLRVIMLLESPTYTLRLELHTQNARWSASTNRTQTEDSKLPNRLIVRY